MIEGALVFATGCIAIALVLTCWRLLRGPESTDRVLALDTLYIHTVGLVILLGIQFASNLLFEAALVIAMLGFVATVALARFIARGDVME
jgi:multicomponent K+:H+ antiporter subunit F